ncbi:MAG TPA: polyphenol oxidase family protein [Actinomycetota bacterium]|nr:polyphenol oxidase family protein [Actinomycetota bacterium]
MTGAKVVFTTRLGGVSRAPFDSLNLSSASGDEPADVERNRRAVSAALGIPAGWATARQVHGCAVVVTGAGGVAPAEADAIVTTEPGTPVAILTADCVPIALAGAGVVAAVHAGWRGLCRGVVAAGAERARAAGGGGSALEGGGSALEGWIGPCIGPCCYEVGPEVPEAFAARFPQAPDCRVMVGGSLHFDLRAASAAALAGAGVRLAGPVDVPCTACDRRFFSHRRDAAQLGATGRQALIAWLDGEEGTPR